jgi:hypothetical protein
MAQTEDQANGSTSSYIDIDALTAPGFDPYEHAATLVQRTNNPSDPTVDLNTPLSRVLFDLQEIDSHIHTLTSKSAFEILEYTKNQNEAAQQILARVEEERLRLKSSYTRLEKEVTGRHARAVEAKTVASRSWEVLRIGRSVQRIVNGARQFETAMSDSGLGSARSGKEDHQALLRACQVLLLFRDVMTAPDGPVLAKINLVRAVRGRVFEDGEARILDYARRIVREFSMSSLTGSSAANATFRDAEDNRARFTSAVHILYLLSPAPAIDGRPLKKDDFEPDYLIRALQSYLQSAITSSSAAIGRALAQLPTLERTTIEVSARCQNIVALEALLRSINAPMHPLLQQSTKENKPHEEQSDVDGDSSDEEAPASKDSQNNLLTPLLTSLDTASLPSYFWRSLASSLGTRVQEIMNRGGISARTLRSQKDTVRAEIRECVLRGSKMPASVSGAAGGKEELVGNWEREAAVMVGAVVGILGR